MRYRSPARAALSPNAFAHPAFKAFADYTAWLVGAEWPTAATLNTRWAHPPHTLSSQSLQFAAQIPATHRDGLHYEARIFETGVIATREASWHDLFNALIWLQYLPLKCALNAAYVREFAVVGGEPRTRVQCALTHFDEGGAVVVLRDRSLLDLWDAHAWEELFCRQRARWEAMATVHLIGHALFDHLLTPRVTPVAKCVVVIAEDAPVTSQLIRTVADHITAGKLLRDPQELRPLPLAALSGWHPENTDPIFYRSAPTFRPLRPGRRYPDALVLGSRLSLSPPIADPCAPDSCHPNSPPRLRPS